MRCRHTRIAVKSITESRTAEKAETMNQITVYTKPACVQCNAVFRALDKAGIEYRKVDISTDPEAREYVMALGYLFSSWFCGVSSLGISLVAIHGTGTTSRAYLGSCRSTTACGRPVRCSCRWGSRQCACHPLLRQRRAIVPVICGPVLGPETPWCIRLWIRPRWFVCLSIGRSRQAHQCSSMRGRCCRSSRCVRGFGILPTTTRTPRPCASMPTSCGGSSISFSHVAGTCSMRPNRTSGRTGLCELSCRTGRLAMRRGPRKPNCSTSSTDGWSNRATYATVRCG